MVMMKGGREKEERERRERKRETEGWWDGRGERDIETERESKREETVKTMRKGL